MKVRSHSLGISIARGIAVLLAGLGSRSVMAQSCTPFGNPPAALAGVQTVPSCTGGQLLGPWNDSDGTPRYACLYESANASTLNRLALIVFLHPSLFSADALENLTNILDSLDTANVSDDPSRLGFIVLAPQGRNTAHFYPPGDAQGLGWDNWYRQVNPLGDVLSEGVPYKENVDAATIDHFIAQEVATGKVDGNRIYLTGWSNGAAMAYLYGTSRLNVAAISPYSTPDPWQAFNDPCPQTPVSGLQQNPGQLQIFNVSVPTLHVHNACDIAGICPNGELMRQQLLPTGVSVQDTILDWSGTPYPNQSPGPVVADACDPTCGTNPLGEDNLSFTVQGLQNHLRWPYNQTAVMLDFFRRHPALTPCAGPIAGCRTAAKSALIMKHNPSKDAKDALIWKWRKSQATSFDDLGLPTGTTAYTLCVYSGASSVLAYTIPGGASWMAIRAKGFKYRDQAATADGISGVVLKSGADGKAEALATGKGPNLPDPTLPVTLPVTTQLVNSSNNICYTSTFATANKNTLTVFTAKSP